MEANLTNIPRVDADPAKSASESGQVPGPEQRSADCIPAGMRETRHWISRVASGKPLPPGYEALTARVEEIVQQIIADLGGETELTGEQRVVLETQRVALTVMALGELYLGRYGLTDKRQRPRAILKVLAPYCNVARLGASVLGLSRVPRKLQDLESVAAEIIAKRKENDGEETEPVRTDAD